MESKVIEITSKGEGIEAALAMTETIASEHGLERKQMLHLRLLGEELFGMLRGMVGELSAEYWLCADEKNFELHMSSRIEMTDELRKQLIATSTSGKNDAAKGFTGRIKVMIANFLLTTKDALPYAMMNAAMAYGGTGTISDSTMMWSMEYYRTEIQRNMEQGEETAEAEEAWDELEKSIVANIADDIKVKIVGEDVEIIVYKAF